MKTLRAASVVLLVANQGRAQTIGGQVFRDTGKSPARRIVVIATDSATGRTAITRADSAGIFYLRVAKPGTYGLSLVAGLAPPRAVGRVRFAGDEFCDVSYLIAVPEDSVLLETEVDVIAALLPGNRAPRYPAALRNAGVTGEVLASFVVDSIGHAVTESFGVLRTSEPGFIGAILDALPGMKFYPARRAGKAVAQRVIMPFTFSVTR